MPFLIKTSPGQYVVGAFVEDVILCERTIRIELRDCWRSNLKCIQHHDDARHAAIRRILLRDKVVCETKSYSPRKSSGMDFTPATSRSLQTGISMLLFRGDAELSRGKSIWSQIMLSGLPASGVDSPL